MTRPDDDAPKTTALHDALRADTPDELDTQIGLGALERYDDAIRTVKVDESESIIGWWRRQPEDVVEALLDAMRRRDESAVEIIEEETETSGVELLGALIRDDDVHGGKWIYEEVVRDHLNAVRAANAADEDGETPSVRAALTGLSNDDTSSTVGATAVANDPPTSSERRTPERAPSSPSGSTVPGARARSRSWWRHFGEATKTTSPARRGEAPEVRPRTWSRTSATKPPARTTRAS